ncbi:unnamed protein product [Phytophthora fragariaefolia]|uniref:Unnamed protein product n=1 Tax=Phytophthora fragariaefolia TaxID=1490495 RepID=A0A9W6Y1Z0_9STRA|nr:unnamed protein product [Phytophthora fragariaefolia]
MIGRSMHRKACIYFLHGNCRYGDSCRFSHVIRAAEYVHTEPDGVGDHRRSGAEAELKSVAPFKLEDLQSHLEGEMASSALSSSHSDALVYFPSGQDNLEALWKGFLMPADPRQVWPMNSQTQALNFINSGLYSLTKENTTRLFVKELGKPEGQGVSVMQKLLDLKYSNEAGMQRDVVSFQKGLVPLVTMLTMRRIELLSPHMDEANYIYSFVRTAHFQLCGIYLEKLKEIPQH